MHCPDRFGVRTIPSDSIRFQTRFYTTKSLRRSPGADAENVSTGFYDYLEDGT